MRFFRRKDRAKYKKPRYEPFKPLLTADWNTKFDMALGETPVHLHYWPAYQNPYQSLFYGAETPLFRAVPGTVDAAIQDLRENAGARVCFHLHWLNFLYQSASHEETKKTVSAFVEKLRIFCAGGGILLWTVHNFHEHDREEGPLEAGLRQDIVELASAVFVHGQSAFDLVRGAFPDAAHKIRVIEHGNYVGVYSDGRSRQDSRAQLGLAPSDTVFLSLGWIRKYKGLLTLCETVETRRNATLVVAGRMRKDDRPDLEGAFDRFRNTRLFEGWIADDDIQLYMNAADYVVLPYIASLTSGAALLALSFGVPVVAPALGAFPEILEDGETGFLYDPDEKGTLAKALDRAESLSGEKRAMMRVAAFEAANRLSWSPARLTLFKTLSDNAVMDKHAKE